MATEFILILISVRGRCCLQRPRSRLPEAPCSEAPSNGPLSPGRRGMLRMQEPRLQPGGMRVMQTQSPPPVHWQFRTQILGGRSAAGQVRGRDPGHLLHPACASQSVPKLWLCELASLTASLARSRSEIAVNLTCRLRSTAAQRYAECTSESHVSDGHHHTGEPAHTAQKDRGHVKGRLSCGEVEVLGCNQGLTMQYPLTSQ